MNLVTDYDVDSEGYWNLRWKLRHDNVKGLEMYRVRWKTQVAQLMKEHGCVNVLDVGCGMGWLRGLQGYLGVDSSLEVFKQNGLNNFLVANAAHSLPLPAKSFDAVVSFFFLMHQSPDKVQVACSEMKRVAKHLIVLRESTEEGSLKHHCFKHDYAGLFEDFEGRVETLEW